MSPLAVANKLVGSAVGGADCMAPGRKKLAGENDLEPWRPPQPVIASGKTASTTRDRIFQNNLTC